MSLLLRTLTAYYCTIVLGLLFSTSVFATDPVSALLGEVGSNVSRAIHQQGMQSNFGNQNSSGGGDYVWCSTHWSFFSKRTSERAFLADIFPIKRTGSYEKLIRLPFQVVYSGVMSALSSAHELDRATFQKISQIKLTWVPRGALKDFPDDNISMLAKILPFSSQHNCRVGQLAIQDIKTGVVQFDQDIFKRLSPGEQALLHIHEKMIRTRLRTEDSTRLRKILLNATQSYLSRSFDELYESAQRRTNFISDLGPNAAEFWLQSLSKATGLAGETSSSRIEFLKLKLSSFSRNERKQIEQNLYRLLREMDQNASVYLLDDSPWNVIEAIFQIDKIESIAKLLASNTVIKGTRIMKPRTRQFPTLQFTPGSWGAGTSADLAWRTFGKLSGVNSLPNGD